MAVTRNKSSKFLLGHPKTFPGIQLPANLDVINHARCIRAQLIESGEYNPHRGIYIAQATQDIINVWKKASLPTILNKTVRDRVNSYLSRMKIGETPVSKRSEAHARLIVISNINSIVTKLLRNIKKANTETSIRVENKGKRLKLIQVADEGVEYSDTELSEEIVESNDPTISLNTELKNSILGNSHYPRNMRNTIQAADGYGISDRALADILNNFLHRFVFK